MPTLVPMTFGWRSVVMCLLWIALPLQGFVAATTRHCAPNHHAGTQATSTALSAAGPVDAAHAQGGRGAADVARAETPLDPSPAHEHARPTRAGDSHAFDAGVKAKCSACASCCVGAALPTAGIFLPACAPEAAPPTALRHERVGFFTDGPDRPPRPPST